jgi:hypothetical protein
MRFRSTWLGSLLAVSLMATPLAAAEPVAQKGAQKGAQKAKRESIDRVVVRWYAQATGGMAKPQFITARQLAFEARIHSMMDPNALGGPYDDKHVRAAIQRHITESMFAALPVDPKPTPKQVGRYAEAARLIIEQNVGGRSRLNAAATAEGISPDELNAMLRLRARASWYIDKMVAPMLTPTELDLREAHERGETPFTKLRFKDVEKQLERWYIETRTAAALDQSYRRARSKLTVMIIER